ncbi:hypothetical protein PAXRUDRAFT_831168 [Paxillus rubicundulus Ve08.2h10]|uniref:Unplaced genomic scaffold scaffold_612, whole genome shotgun sequence n=1 Tax=Paxillus rubicundulus Ve08.2h10 TaxID=930991 RepID=A0A0D0DJ23_9AGAM|nr:hypothetical protein PAXRUDRAFT_831168 [Paxillus rubicundulus Ve08.2h10]
MGRSVTDRVLTISIYVYWTDAQRTASPERISTHLSVRCTGYHRLATPTPSRRRKKHVVPLHRMTWRLRYRVHIPRI